MTWAEFRIRSFGFKRVRQFSMFLTREIAYEVHVGHYVWGKKKPPNKDKFWNITGTEQKGSVNKDIIESFRKKRADYLKKENGWIKRTVNGKY